jgi:hypothetical protein
MSVPRTIPLCYWDYMLKEAPNIQGYFEAFHDLKPVMSMRKFLSENPSRATVPLMVLFLSAVLCFVT